MGPKKPIQRRLSAKTAAVTTSADDASPLSFIPADPEDARLTFDGLVLDTEGKVDVCAYEDLMPCFSGEPSPEQHPDPQHPGIRRGERIPKGLRIWDDLRAGGDRGGAGWVAVHYGKKDGGDRKKEKWFNIRVCGSWRMAFLLARLQRMYWDERAAWLRTPILLPGSDNGSKELAHVVAEAEGDDVGAVVSEAPSLEATKLSGAEQTVCTGLPSASAASTGDVAKSKDPITPKKRPLPGAKEERAQKSAKKIEKTKERKPKCIGADTLASSVRLQQILAARQQQVQ